MPKMKPKSTNSLMKYLRDNKGIAISSVQKRKLMNMGYYHGYKGYLISANHLTKFHIQSLRSFLLSMILMPN